MDLAESIQNLSDTIGPVIDWANTNWVALVLTGEIVGAAIAIKMRSYKRGILWLLIALATIWIKGISS